MSLTSNFILEHLYEQWEGECGEKLSFAPVFFFFFGLKNLEMLVHQLYLMSKSHAPLIPCPKSSCCIRRGGKFLRLCEVKINCQEHHTPLATVRNPMSEPHPDSEIQPRMCGSLPSTVEAIRRWSWRQKLRRGSKCDSLPDLKLYHYMNNHRRVHNRDHHQNQMQLSQEFSELNSGDSVLHRGPVMPCPTCWNVTSPRPQLNSKKGTWYWFTGRVWREDEGSWRKETALGRLCWSSKICGKRTSLSITVPCKFVKYQNQALW